MWQLKKDWGFDLRLVIPALALLVLVALLPQATAYPSSESHYERTTLTYTISDNRWVSAEENFTIVNPSSRWRYSYTTYIITRTIFSSSVEDLKVWDDLGRLSYTTQQTADRVTIQMEFKLWPNERLTYHIEYAADGLVSGSWPEYKASFGGIRTGDFRHDNYIITVRGPKGTFPFLTKPKAKLVENELPTIRFETQLGTKDEFEGVLVHFYSYPVYYKLTLTECFTNPGVEDSREVWFYAILSGQMSSQFAALASGPPLKAMYVDNDNNWHAVFDIGTIQAGSSRTENVEVIFELNIHESGANESNTGSIADIPTEFPSYAEYLREDNYWEVNHPLIRQKAQEIRGGENNAYLLAKSIVEWVGKNIEYEERERQGALKTLVSRKGDCDCFSDLTIALSRAAGLPARMSGGWAYENATLGGHAWVEFYLPNHGWQPADPTWAKNLGNYLGRLDPIHLLRSTRGLSSVVEEARVMYYGGAPQIDENRSLILLTPSQAVEGFIESAEVAIGMAEQLLGEELTNARSSLLQAQGAEDDGSRISFAKLAIEQANEVIRALGKAPERVAPPLILPDWLVWVCVAVVTSCLVAIVGFKLRSRA